MPAPRDNNSTTRPTGFFGKAQAATKPKAPKAAPIVKSKRPVAAPKVQPNPDTRDPGGLKKAETFKHTARYATATRAAYAAATPTQRRTIVDNAKNGGTINYKRGTGESVGTYTHRTREQAIDFAEHVRRITQAQAAEDFHLHPSGAGDVYNDLPLARKFNKETSTPLARAIAATSDHEFTAPVKGGGGLAVINPFNPDNLLHQAGAPLAAADRALYGTITKPASALLGLVGVHGFSKEAGKIAGNAARDLVDIPAQTIPSLYGLAGAGVQAAHGNTKPLTDMGKGIVKQVTSPKEWEAHPLIVPLLARGGVSAIGHTAGTAARTVGRLPLGTLAERARGVGSIDRAPITLTSTGEKVDRRYSKDLSRKYLTQKPTDAARARLAASDKPRAKALARTIEHHHLKHAINEEVGVIEATRRYQRERVHQTLAGVPKKGVAKELAPFVYEGTVRAHNVAGDLRDRLAQLQHEHTSLEHAAHKQLNENMQQQIKDLLADPKLLAKPDKVFAGAKALSERQHSVDKALVERGHLLGKQAQKARLIPYAVRFMDATHDKEPRLTEAGVKAVAAEAKVAQTHQALKEAGRKVTEARVKSARKEGDVKVRVSQRDQYLVRNEKAVKATRDVHLTNVRKLSALNRAAREATDPLERTRIEAQAHKVRAEASASSAVHKTARATAAERLRQGERKTAPTRLGTEPPRALSGLEKLRGKLKEAEVNHAKAKVDLKTAKEQMRAARVRKADKTYIPGLVHPDGRPMSIEDIQTHMKAHGVQPDDVGFMTHRGGVLGAAAGYKRALGDPQYEARFKRTGESFRKGLYEANFKALADSAVRSQGILDAVDGRIRIVNRFGVTKSNGGYYTDSQEAWHAAQDLALRDPHAVEMVPFKVADERLDSQRMMAFKDNLDPHTASEFVDEIDNSPINQTAHDLAATPGPRAEPVRANYVLMPKVVAEQVAQHDAVLSKVALDRGLQAFTARWRSSILHATSVFKWTFGNSAELFVRLAIAGVRPWHLATGKRIVDTLLNDILKEDPQEAARVRNFLLSGGHFEGTNQAWVKDYMRADRGALGKQMTRLAKAPGIKHLDRTWAAYKGVVLKANRVMEVAGDYAAIGKLASNDLQALSKYNDSFRNAIFAQRAAINDVAHGLLETSEQTRYARYVHETIGQYVNLSPNARRIIQNYSTFGMWYANALKFVFVTMPREHPITQSLIAAGYVGTEKQRAKAGDTMFGDHRKLDFLQGTIDYGGHLHNWARYVPFGVTDNLSGNTTAQLLPQYSSIIEAFDATNFTHNKLKTGSGKDPDFLTRLTMAGYITIEGMVPFAPDVRRAVDKSGKAAFDDALLHKRVKPGTEKGVGYAIKSTVIPGYKIESKKKSSGGVSLPGLPSVSSTVTLP